MATYLQLILHIIKNGKVSTSWIDFDKIRRARLGTLAPSQYSISPIQKIRKVLLSNKWLRFVIINLSYLKNPKKLNRQYFIYPTQHLIYLRIFKSASTSILKQLLPILHPEKRFSEMTSEQIDTYAFYLVKRKLTNTEKKFTKFSIVRDPFKRVVSAYIDLFESDSDFFGYQDFLFGIFNRRMSFNQFIKVLQKIPDAIRGPHFSSQYYLLSCMAPVEDILVFKLEDSTTTNRLFTQFNIRLEHYNQAQKPYDYRKYFTSELVDIVYHIYKIDFDNFGYNESYNQMIQHLNDT